MVRQDNSTNPVLECLSCHFKTSTEDFYESGGAIYCQRCFSRIEARGARRTNLTIAATLIALALVAASVLGWYFFLRDTWGG